MGEDVQGSPRRKRIGIAVALSLMCLFVPGCFLSHDAPGMAGAAGHQPPGDALPGPSRPMPVGTTAVPGLPAERVSYTVTLRTDPLPSQPAAELSMTWTVEPARDPRQLLVALSAYGEASQAVFAYDLRQARWSYRSQPVSKPLWIRSRPVGGCSELEALSFTRLWLRFPDATSLEGEVQGILTHGDGDDSLVGPFSGSVRGVLDVAPPQLLSSMPDGMLNPFDGLRLLTDEALPADTAVTLQGGPEPIALEPSPAHLPSSFRLSRLPSFGAQLWLEVLPQLQDLAGNAAREPLPRYGTARLPGPFSGFGPPLLALLEGSTEIVDSSLAPSLDQKRALLLPDDDASFSARLLVPPKATQLVVTTRALYRDRDSSAPLFRLRTGVLGQAWSSLALEFAPFSAGVETIDSGLHLSSAHLNAQPLSPAAVETGEVYVQIDFPDDFCGYAPDLAAALVESIVVH
ncbi:MAG: hypothetical protein MJD61_02795 [Proteobacteria bacterium]|nr:hypothetical protein [Pseudomonadota bacterium]